MGNAAAAVPGLRAALADLAARASDLEEESDDLGLAGFTALIQDCATVEDALAVMTQLATGYGNLAHKLLIEWARTSRRPQDHLLDALGRWVSKMETL